MAVALEVKKASAEAGDELWDIAAEVKVTKAATGPRIPSEWNSISGEGRRGEYCRGRGGWGVPRLRLILSVSMG
jgi:hypothetical protein